MTPAILQGENHWIPILITGMVRSGTTLISRAVDAHPRIICPADPFMGFFKLLRNSILRKTTLAMVDEERPLEDFFFAEGLTVEEYQSSDLRLPLNRDMDDVRAYIAEFARINLPDAAGYVSRLDARDYSDLFMQLLGILRDLFPEGTIERVGFKQTWVEGLVAPILNTWSDASCVHIIRDPRAVIASWKKTDKLAHDYPFLMMIRQWRKSVALASMNARRYPNYAIVRYEDFIQNPEQQLRRICKLFKIEYLPEMIQFARYRDASGKRWASNTSYQMNSKEISDCFLDAWMHRLEEGEIQFIEDLCDLELGWMGYQRKTESRDLPISFFEAPLVVRALESNTDWMSRYRAEYVWNMTNFGKELSRWFLAKRQLTNHSGLGSMKAMRRVFLDLGMIGHNEPCSQGSER